MSGKHEREALMLAEECRYHLAELELILSVLMLQIGDNFPLYTHSCDVLMYNEFFVDDA